MRLFDDIGNTLKELRVFAFGKGFMMTAMGIAATVAHFFPAIPFVAMAMPIIFVGGVALTAVNRLYQEGLYKDQMTDLYRDDIAQQFGIAPQQVTRAHLMEAAKSNEVIDQALKRQRNKTVLALGTSMLAGTVTWGLFGMFGADSMLRTWATETFKSGIAGTLANFVGLGTLSTITGLFFNTGLREIIEMTTPVGKASAHDRILELEYQLKRGQSVTKEQVYGVLVAGDANLQHAVQKQFHKPYGWMTQQEQAQVLATIGVSQEMLLVAMDINAGTVRPGKLAYMLQGEPMPPRAMATSPHMVESAEQSNCNFVERLGLKPKHNHSFREQIAIERSNPAERGLA